MNDHELLEHELNSLGKELRRPPSIAKAEIHAIARDDVKVTAGELRTRYKQRTLCRSLMRRVICCGLHIEPLGEADESHVCHRVRVCASGTDRPGG